MTDEDRKKQAEVLTAIGKLPKGTTIKRWNKKRFTDDVLRPVRAEIRASFYVPPKQRIH